MLLGEVPEERSPNMRSSASCAHVDVRSFLLLADFGNHAIRSIECRGQSLIVHHCPLLGLIFVSSPHFELTASLSADRYIVNEDRLHDRHITGPPGDSTAS